MVFSVKTATGKEFPIRYMGDTVIGITSVLYIELIGETLMSAIPIFSNKEETYYLQGLVEGEVEKEYRGYTNLIEAIILSDTGNLRITLTAPIDAIGQ